jgi:hypothetical protein
MMNPGAEADIQVRQSSGAFHGEDQRFDTLGARTVLRWTFRISSFYSSTEVVEGPLLPRAF